MEAKLIANQRKMPLRMMAPHVYEELMETLAQLHIHPFDVKADAVRDENGLRLVIRYGDGFNQTDSRFFTNESLKRMDGEVIAFFNDIKDACQKAMKTDYFSTMNPAMNIKAN